MTDAFDVTLDRARTISRGQPDDGLVRSATSDCSVQGVCLHAPTGELFD